MLLCQVILWLSAQSYGFSRTVLVTHNGIVKAPAAEATLRTAYNVITMRNPAC
jgi:hypothetical protein